MDSKEEEIKELALEIFKYREQMKGNVTDESIARMLINKGYRKEGPVKKNT